MKTAVAILLLVSLIPVPAAYADADPQQGAVIGYSCLGCHGIEGYRNAYPSYRVPKLGGQKRSYVESSLRSYRDGARAHPTMKAQGGSLSETDISDVSSWLELYGEASDAATAESAAGVPAAAACVVCHGVAGEGVAPQPPTLAGQHRDYLVNALRQYKDGSRSGTVMTAFVATLSDEDVENVARFYASQDGLFTPATED